MVGSDTLTLSVGIVVVSVLLITFLLYTRQRLKRRGAQLRLELDDRPEAKGDRAFNQIRIATTEAGLLERSGVEVDHARDLLGSAQRAYDRRDWDSALREARSAHESLVALRGKAPKRLPSVGPERSPTVPFRAAVSAPTSAAVMPTVIAAAPSGTSGSVFRSGAGEEPMPAAAESGGARLAKNRAEAHFQLTLLAEEVERARRGAEGASATAEADEVRAESQEAYARGDYTEALRLALRGRRRIGGRLETLPPSRAAQPDRSALGPSPSGPGPVGAALPPSTCPRCGKGVRASDRFCRGCGATLGASQCTRCGQPVLPDDTFCGACGAPVAP